MGKILEKRMKERSKALAPATKKSKINSLIEFNLPRYGEDGDIKSTGLRVPKALIIILAVVFVAVAAVYVPSFFYKDKSSGNNSVEAKYNQFYKTQDNPFLKYITSHPDADFDEDGLSNEIEKQRGTDPRNIDTDGDGCSDYVEIYITGSDPLVPGNELVKYIKAQTAEANRSVNSPYKVNDVVMWPENWDSRAHGTVVKTINGYRFCGFKGWAQFPTGYTAYKEVNGIHKALSYRSEEKAYYIDDDSEITFYAEPLKTTYKFCWLGNETVKPDTFLYRVLNFLLPDNSGFIACKKITDVDSNKPQINKLEIQIAQLDTNNLPDARFGRNMNQLSDLAYVYNAIRAGKCILMSIYSEDYGEAIFEVYGFDDNGALLVADPEILEPIGLISIREYASRIMLGENTMRTYEWFSISGDHIPVPENAKIYFFNEQILDACKNGHTWLPANCTEPRRCAICGATEGEPLGHEWIDQTEQPPADGEGDDVETTPRKCARCGILEP